MGTYVCQHAASLDIAIKHILEEYSENPGINQDDMFITNDPYVGVIHQPDVMCLAPVHWKGELIAWCGSTVHQPDVGGPVPGSFGVGATSIYGEAPPTPPVKLVDRGVLRKDIECEFKRRSRLPEFVALDLRAQIAANNVAKARIHELIEQYGLGTFQAVMDQMVDYVEAKFRSRLRELPDGVWRDIAFLDHDGIENKIYPVKLTMTKKEESLTLDFTESAEQAPALINVCRGGLAGGVMVALLPMLCYDMPWTPAALWRVIKLVSKPGTVVDAAWPAGTSLASIAALRMASMCTNNCVGKMLAASEKYKDHSMAAWQANSASINFMGVNQRGELFVTMWMDGVAGGTGARSYKDGINTGGPLASMTISVANVETNEYLFPFLYLYRRQLKDSGGPGMFRGGVSSEFAFTLHDTSKPVDCIPVTHGVEQPVSSGMFGGYPANTVQTVIKRKSNIKKFFQQGKLPTTLAEFEGELLVLPAKAVLQLNEGDVLQQTACGGAGYGDPLDRNPELVVKDITNGLVSLPCAKELYGVVTDSNLKLDMEKTSKQREEMKEKRCQRVRSVSPVFEPGELGRAIGEYLEIIQQEGIKKIRCRKCRHVICDTKENYKYHIPMAEFLLTRAGPLVNPYEVSKRFILREFYCSGCATMVAVELNFKDAEIIWDIEIEDC